MRTPDGRLPAGYFGPEARQGDVIGVISSKGRVLAWRNYSTGFDNFSHGQLGRLTSLPIDPLFWTFWLTLVVGMALGWWMREQRFYRESRRTWNVLQANKRDIATAASDAVDIERQLEARGIFIDRHLGEPIVEFPSR